MKKNKGIIITLVILFFIVAIRVFCLYDMFSRFNKILAGDIILLSEIESHLKYNRWIKQNDDDNIPDYITNFIDPDKIDKLFDKTYNFYKSNQKKLYNTKFQDDLLKQAETDFSEQNAIDLVKIKNEYVPIIKNKINQPKHNIPTSIEESQNADKAPSPNSIRNICKSFFALSRLYEKDDDYETALLLNHSIFYLTKDYESNYCTSGSLQNKIVCQLLNNFACDSILIWANKVQKPNINTAKIVAKDILDFTSNSYPLSSCLKYEAITNRDLLNSFFKTIGYGMEKQLNSQNILMLTNSYYLEPQSYIDKPVYEIKRLLDNKQRHIDNLSNEYENIFKPIYLLFNAENYIALHFLKISFTEKNIVDLKLSYEENLAKMEMAAIAILLNAFYCDKNKLPKTMQELSVWFGSELPNNRLANEPYKIETKGKHIILNNGIDGKANTYDDFFFDF